MHLKKFPFYLLSGLALLAPFYQLPAGSQAAGLAAPAAVQAPVLKWSKAGCLDGTWCETGWYSSPAVADLNGDGNAEVIASTYSIYVLDGASGEVKWEMASGHDRREPGADNVGRTWPDIAVADLDQDGSLEIVSAHSGGWVSVYNNQGYFEPGWPQQFTSNELRSMGVHDLDGDGDLEIMVASTRSQNQWTVFEHDGAQRAGTWPQHAEDSNTNGYTAGCFNQNLAAGDVDGDGKAEIIGPNDTHYIAAFNDDGSQLRASSIYGTNPDGSNKFWSRVGVHVDHNVDLRGYADCGVEHRPNFAGSAPIIVDVNGDGSLETVVVGNVHNCGTDPYTDLYEMAYILNGNRTRWKSGAYDWTAIPSPDGNAGPLSEDYELIENQQPNPVAADLDGNGELEILYSSYDGRVHAYWLDKTEHGNWPYSVYHASDGYYRFAGEPLVADLNLDGKPEVIFASWVQKGTYQTGRLHILDSLGNPLHEIDLPPATLSSSHSWNGALAAPTLADIDGDPDLELVLNTAHSGVIAYDLPGSAGAQVLWGTGRGSYQRSGSLIVGNLNGSGLAVSDTRPDPGETITFTLTLRNPGPGLSLVSVDGSLPEGLADAGGLQYPSGSGQILGNTLHWEGPVPGGQPVSIEWQATVSAAAGQTQSILNTLVIDDGQGNTLQRQALLIVNGSAYYLPLVRQ